MLLALTFVLGLLPSAVFASQEANKPTKVVVSVEGQTLSQGYYIDPTIVTFNEFIQYWADKGETVLPGDITAGGVLSYALQKNGTPMDNAETPGGPGYLAKIKKIDKGNAKLPQFLADAGVTLNEKPNSEGSDLGQYDYTYSSGWMYTEGNIMSNQALAGHVFYTYGTPYTQEGEAYYVVRLQFTVDGLGADLGFSRYATYSYSYEAADKGQLYILYAKLSADGFFDRFQEVKEQALSVMNTLNATQAEVDAAYETLLGASLAEKPVFTKDLSEELVSYPLNAEALPLEVLASVSQGSLTYEWFQSEDKLEWNSLGDPGAENTSYTPSTAQTGTKYYKCVVTNYDATTELTNTAESKIATIVSGVATPVFQTDLDETEKSYILTDTPETLVVSAGAPDNGTLSYQWYESADKSSWTSISGQTAAGYTPELTTIGTRYYKCKVTNTREDEQSSADSRIATVTVRADVPSFTTNLRTTSYYPKFDESFSLEVEVSVRDGGTVSYQWYSGESWTSDGSVDGMTPIEGATDSCYKVDTSKVSAYYYKVQVTNTVQGQTATAVSNWSRVAVEVEKPYFDADLEREVSYLIGDICEPLRVSASVTDGGTVSYQWYQSDTNPWGSISYMTPIEGATESTYQPDIHTAGTVYYACRATNTNRGDTASADSRVIQIIVRACQQPIITKDLEDEAEYVAGDPNPAPLEIEASVSDGGTLSYQWYRAEGWAWSVDYMEPIEGATQPSYTPDITKGGVKYACRVTNTTDKGSEFIDSNIIEVVVSCAAPVLSKDLSAETVTYDKNAPAQALTVEASVSDGGTLSYQWYRELAGGYMEEIPGATEASYTPSTAAAGTVRYQVTVTNTRAGISNSTDSTMACVTVLAPLEYITTEEELRAMDSNGNYQLTADIHLTEPWKPIDRFSGTLDGDGHTISGLVIEGNGDPIGFFNKTGTGATIKNLGLTGTVTQTGYGTTGGLIGRTAGDGLTVSNCYVNVEVNGNQYYNVGGLIGQMENSGIIENCYFTGTLSGGTDWAYAGGLVGQTYDYGAIIRNSYTTWDVAVGKYSRYNADETVNNYCASDTDEYATEIPTDMDAFLIALNNGGNAFAADKDNINNGYPVLSWQADDSNPNPDLDLNLDKHLAALLQKVPNPVVGSTGGEWAVLGLARAGYKVPEKYFDNYYIKAVQFIKENINDKEQLHSVKSTENSRLILALTAIGKDVTDVAGHNLLAGLSDLDYLKKQGINGPIWALIALDSHEYEIPALKGDGTQATRENILAYILDKQLEDGGWTLSGKTADPDMTGMALQALAPYYSTNADVKAAVDKALGCLSDIQLENGGFSSWGEGENVESCVQVIAALTALGIDPTTDARFVKANGNTLSSLLRYALPEGGFEHILGGGYDAMATEQGILALVAYDRFVNSKNSLYDMSDVKINTNPNPPKLEDKDITLTDVNGSGITLTGKESILNENMELEANLLTSGDLYDKVKETLNNDKFTLYDLYLLENNLEVQPDGTITISIPVPADYDGAKCKMYRVNADGSITEITAVLQDGKLVFDTDHVGMVAVWQPVSAGTDESGDNPQTGDNGNIMLWFAFSAFSMATLTALAKKKKQHAR